MVADPRYTRTDLIELPGRTWLARFSSRPSFEREMESHQSLVVAVLGMLVDLLLFFIVMSLSGQRDRIQEQAREIARALGRAETRYRDLVENVKEVIFRIDPQGCWSFLNPAWEEVSGHAVEASLGRSFLEYVHPADRPRVSKQFGRLLRGEVREVFQEEFGGLHRNGGTVWIEVNATVESGEGGAVIGVSGSLRDIDLRKRTELELLRARDAAESANRAKSEFLANMSHELRTPLNSLLILSRLLAEAGNLTPEQTESARVIHESGTELLQLINDIMDLSKIEAGRMEVLAERFSLDELLEGVRRQFAPVARARGLTLELSRAPELPATFCTDSAKLGQILRNLLANALKFTERGGVRLRLARPAGGSDLEWSPDRVVAFEVADSGIGIPADKLEVIFENFCQVDGATSRKYGGTGLGLSISRKLARLLGGEIRVASREGSGSTFTLLLPELASGGEEEPRVEPLPVLPGLREFHVPATLLVVDDDMRTAFSLAKGLQPWVETVLLAADGRKCLEELAAHPEVDVVLMDMRMPHLDGYAALRAIRAEARFAHVGVVAITAATGASEAERCLAAGADLYLAKPAALEEILEGVGKVMSVRAARAC